MIGYYIHHHGRGHLARASSVAAAAADDVVALSSLPEPAAHRFLDWIPLPPDPALPDMSDARGGGALHWAPLNSSGYSARMGRLAQWATVAQPRLVVVDVSVEVTGLLRLLGFPVVVVAGAGQRDDSAHTLAYRLATRIIAPWQSQHRMVTGLQHFDAKTTYVGAISRFDGRRPGPPPRRRAVLVLSGAGGDDVSGDLVDRTMRRSTWRWRRAGGTGQHWSDDVWSELQNADVVVTHAGMNAVAEVAAARRPAVVVPQARPFGEQHAIAGALAAAGLATVLPYWPEAGQWDHLLTRAVAGDRAHWAAWNDGTAGGRIARCLAEPRTG